MFHKLLLAGVVSVALTGTAFATCDVQTAVTRYSTLGQTVSQAATQGQLNTEQQTQIGPRMSEVGAALSSQNYDRACELIDKIYEDFRLPH